MPDGCAYIFIDFKVFHTQYVPIFSDSPSKFKQYFLVTGYIIDPEFFFDQGRVI